MPMPTEPSKELETIPNPEPDRDYVIEIECPEFTCVCPRTGQPDFAVFKISYVPGPKLVELKSLKLYMWSYRNEGHYHEEVTNRVLSDLVKALQPKKMVVEAEFNVRGGIRTVVRATYPDDGVLDSI